MRNDIEKAKEVSRDIRRGKLRSFSIGGQAMSKANRYDPDIGTYKEIDKLELHEVTICEEGINPEAKFEIIKEQKNYENKKGDKMSDEINKALEEFNGIVSQLREQVNSTIAKEESDDEVYVHRVVTQHITCPYMKEYNDNIDEKRNDQQIPQLQCPIFYAMKINYQFTYEGLLHLEQYTLTQLFNKFYLKYDPNKHNEHIIIITD